MFVVDVDPRRERAMAWAVGEVLDDFSRKVVRWAMGEEMTANLVLLALEMPLHTRKPESVIHHSD